MIDATQSRTGLYNSIAPIYDHLHLRFLRIAGGGAQGTLEGAVTALLEPGIKILDVGCGTGQLSRRLLASDRTLNLTLLDPAPAMLFQTQDVAARRIHGSLYSMPFESEAFDLVICAWVIETVEEPFQAIDELWRVTRIGGHVCVVFSAETNCSDMFDRLVIGAVKLRGTGKLLSPCAVEAKLKSLKGGQVRRISCQGPAAVYLLEKIK
jgi:ubiquinone/menaquinone biosynthesis C-methylase UbiE